MLKAKIGNVEISPGIMNASGPRCITEDELMSLANSEAGAIVTKSMTLKSREGNPLPRYFADKLGTINSTGLANLGYQSYEKIIPRIREKTHKPVIASIAGLKYNHFHTMARAMDKVADVVEVNLSCPNVIGKPQIGYDFETSDKLLGEMREIITVPMTVKLPPYLDHALRQKMADILLKNDVDGVTLINSIGHSLIIDIDKEQTSIKPNNGLGGLGGKYIKPVALGNIWGFYRLFQGKIPIIGVGGIYSGADAYEHFLAGASAVQIGSAYQEENISVFARVKKELLEIMQRKGVSSIHEKIGKLKVIG